MATKPYEAKFAVGERVRVQSRDTLEQFKREWRYHNPLSEEQLAYAGTVSHVREVGFFHGGEPLYALTDAPGVLAQTVSSCRLRDRFSAEIC